MLQALSWRIWLVGGDTADSDLDFTRFEVCRADCREAFDSELWEHVMSVSQTCRPSSALVHGQRSGDFSRDGWD